jgi:nitroreductase
LVTLILAVTELRLGTCPVVNFDEKAAKKALGVPNEIRGVAMTPSGYLGEEKGQVTDRKPLAKIVHNEKWQTTKKAPSQLF